MKLITETRKASAGVCAQGVLAAEKRCRELGEQLGGRQVPRFWRHMGVCELLSVSMPACAGMFTDTGGPEAVSAA